MQKNRIDDSSLLIAVRIVETPQLIAYVDSLVGVAKTRKDKQARKEVSVMFTPEQYEKEWINFGLIPYAAIKVALASGQFVADGYESYDGDDAHEEGLNALPYYNYSDLFAYAVDNNLVIEKEKEVVQEFTTKETYFEVAILSSENETVKESNA